MTLETIAPQTLSTTASRIATHALRGAGASLSASLIMGAMMLGANRLGWLGEPPPRKLTRRLLGLHRSPSAAGRARLNAATVAGHLGYGAGAGALFGALAAPLDRPRDRTLAGACFGAALWAVSYAGWIPAVGLMPPPQADRPGRPMVMFLAHLLFGAVLGNRFVPDRAPKVVDEDLGTPIERVPVESERMSPV